MRDVASKAADNAARLAALFHTFEHGVGGEVGTEAFEGAARVIAWHLNESRRFFGELALPVTLANAARLDLWLARYCQREHTRLVPMADALRLGPLRNKAAIESAMHELEELSRARLVQDGRRRNIAVNPALISGGKQ